MLSSSDATSTLAAPADAPAEALADMEPIDMLRSAIARISTPHTSQVTESHVRKCAHALTLYMHAPPSKELEGKVSVPINELDDSMKAIAGPPRDDVFAALADAVCTPMQSTSLPVVCAAMRILSAFALSLRTSENHGLVSTFLASPEGKSWNFAASLVAAVRASGGPQPDARLSTGSHVQLCLTALTKLLPIRVIVLSGRAHGQYGNVDAPFHAYLALVDGAAHALHPSDREAVGAASPPPSASSSTTRARPPSPRLGSPHSVDDVAVAAAFSGLRDAVPHEEADDAHMADALRIEGNDPPAPTGDGTAAPPVTPVMEDVDMPTSGSPQALKRPAEGDAEAEEAGDARTPGAMRVHGGGYSELMGAAAASAAAKRAKTSGEPTSSEDERENVPLTQRRDNRVRGTQIADGGDAATLAASVAPALDGDGVAAAAMALMSANAHHEPPAPFLPLSTPPIVAAPPRPAQSPPRERLPATADLHRAFDAGEPWAVAYITTPRAAPPVHPEGTSRPLNPIHGPLASTAADARPPRPGACKRMALWLGGLLFSSLTFAAGRYITITTSDMILFAAAPNLLAPPPNLTLVSSMHQDVCGDMDAATEHLVAHALPAPTSFLPGASASPPPPSGVPVNAPTRTSFSAPSSTAHDGRDSWFRAEGWWWWVGSWVTSWTTLAASAVGLAVKILSEPHAAPYVPYVPYVPLMLTSAAPRSGLQWVDAMHGKIRGALLYYGAPLSESRLAAALGETRLAITLGRIVGSVGTRFGGAH